MDEKSQYIITDCEKYVTKKCECLTKVCPDTPKSGGYTFDLKFQEGKFEVQIDTKAGYGYFEHDTLGDECGGGLWFDENKILLDADGTSSVPISVAIGLRKHGFHVDEEFV